MDKELRMKCARVKNLTLAIRDQNGFYCDATDDSQEEYCSLDTNSQDDGEDDDSLEE
jgi:hypothetical protein